MTAFERWISSPDWHMCLFSTLRILFQTLLYSLKRLSAILPESPLTKQDVMEHCLLVVTVVAASNHQLSTDSCSSKCPVWAITGRSSVSLAQACPIWAAMPMDWPCHLCLNLCHFCQFLHKEQMTLASTLDQGRKMSLAMILCHHDVVCPWYAMSSQVSKGFRFCSATRKHK